MSLNPFLSAQLKTNNTLRRRDQHTLLQPKLKIGEPNDKYEKEADRVADAVMRMPDSGAKMQTMKDSEQLQMQPAAREEMQMKQNASGAHQMCPRCRERFRQGKPIDCPECSKKLQMKPGNRDQNKNPMYSSKDISSQLETSKGGGNPLPSRVQREMSDKIGANFGNVNIHTGSKAIQMNQALGARAFTHGRNIYFNRGQYDPGSSGGKHLLAHELTHVVQQSSSSDIPQIQKACMDGTWRTEYDGCSVPPKVASMIGAAHKDNPSGGSDTHFALPDGTRDRPCDRHDECYQTCHNNPNAKLMCDWKMYDDMMAVCVNSRENEEIKEQCRKYAWIYLNGLMDAGTIAFLGRQQQVCSCEGGGISTEEHLSGFQLPLGLSQPLGKNVILNAGAGTFRPASGEASLAAGAQLTWRF